MGSPLTVPSSHHQYASIFLIIDILIFFLVPLKRSKFSLCLIGLFVGRTFRRDVIIDYGAGPELLGSIRCCTQYVCTCTEESSNRKICCQSDHTKVDGALRRKLVSRGLLMYRFLICRFPNVGGISPSFFLSGVSTFRNISI